jgi:SSS family solute:Na+ symporter
LPPSIITALGIFYSLVAVTLFVPVIGGLYSARAGSREALAAIGVGLVVRLALQFFNGGRGIGVLDPTLLATLAAGLAFLAALATNKSPALARPSP